MRTETLWLISEWRVESTLKAST